MDKKDQAQEQAMTQESETDPQASVETDQEPSSALTEQEIVSHEDGRQWYIIQCYTGQEYKVKERIDTLIAEHKWQERFFRVLVPEEEIVEVKNNKRIERKNKIYPGYAFVQMILDDELYYNLRRVTGVAKFIGSKTMPTPVKDDEILKILRKIGDKTRKIDVDFEEGEMIKVVSGPFRGYSGPISEIHPEKGILKALISIFGRETPVKLDFNQVEKAVK